MLADSGVSIRNMLVPHTALVQYRTSHSSALHGKVGQSGNMHLKSRPSPSEVTRPFHPSDAGGRPLCHVSARSVTDIA
eukprot:3339483-Rhodomonas_salina.1